MKILLLPFLLGISWELLASVNANISIIYKKSIEHDLVLVSELHSLERVFEHDFITLTMKNGVRLRLRGGFKKNIDLYGPNEKVHFMGIVFSGKQQDYVSSKRFEIDVALKQKHKHIFENESGETIEVFIEPFVKRIEY